MDADSQASDVVQLGEEPEYVARYTAVKHSWRGRYKRIMCLTSSAIVTQDPSTLAATNHYDLITEFDGVTPSPGKDETLDFSLSVRAGERGKFKPIKFSCRNRAGLLTDVYKVLETLRLEKQVVPPPVDFPVLHLKRKSREWVALTMRVTVTGIETLHESSSTLHWSVAFKDLASPALVVFADPYGRGGGQGGGFVLRPAYGRSKKAFTATQGSTLSNLITKITSMAKQYVGVTLFVDNTQKMTVQDFLKERATAAVGAEETPLGEWSVVRLRSAGKGTVHTIGSVAGAFAPRQAGSRGSDVAVLRQLVLTRSALVERRPDNYEAVIVRPLSSVSALVRFAEEPQMLAIEFNDGCSTHVYSSTARDSLLACVLDAVQTEAGRPLQVLPRPTLPGHRIDPLGNVASISSAGKSGDMEIPDSSHLKYLAQAAKECLAEGGASPAAKSKLWRRVREFNANVPYSGLPPNADVPEAALMALLSMLPAPANTAPGGPPAPAPSAKAATAVIGILACVRRLLGSVGATSTVVGIMGAVVRVMGQLRSGSEGVSAEAAGLIAMLVGGGPGEGGVMGRERAALLQNAKQALLANAGQITVLVSRLKPITVSPLLSLQVVAVLEAMLCEPHSESTDDRTFHEMLRQVANLRRRLFALFAHPAAGVFETVALIMRTIAEEDGGAAEPMRDAALKDGALLRHLVHALFLPSGERREVSRQLVALWADAHEPALELLARCLPPGLVAYLYTRPSDDDVGDLTTFAGAHQRRLLQRRRGRGAAAKAPSVTEPPPPPAVTLPPPPYAADSLVAPGAAATSPPRIQTPPTVKTPAQLPSPNNQIVPASPPGAPESVAIVPHSNGGEHVQPADVSSHAPPSYSQVMPSSPAAEAAPTVAIPVATPSSPRDAPGGKLRYNWADFWRQFERDHSRADLIWNERTRQELKEALDSEVHSLELERDRAVLEDVAAPTEEEGDAEDGEREAAAEEKAGGQLSWNYAEFRVKYASLAKEVCVGEYYLRLLLETSTARDSQPFPLRDPPAFFRALYHRFLCDADAGLFIEGLDENSHSLSREDFCDVNGLDGFGGSGGVGGQTRELCARAMALVYDQHKERIGPFDGTAHVTVLLDRTNDRALRHRLVLLLQALVKVPSNARACVAVGGVELAVDLLASAHEAAERAVTPSQNNLIAATAHVEPPKVWYYRGKGDAKEGPVEKDQIRRLWSTGEIEFSTKCWAEGMNDWKPLRAIRELRWAMAKKTAVLTPVQVGEVALSILHDLVSLHSSVDDYGELVTPAPVVKRILSSPRCLPHLAQGVLTGEPKIVELAASLMEVIITYNPPAMARLYSSGAFYFALAYAGANLRTIASLFKKAHLHQAFHGGADAAVASALPLAKRSVLGGLLPESLLYVLEKSGAQAFAAAMVADSDTPEIIWTHKMRSERLIHQVHQHLGDFPSKLPQHCHSLYDYAPMPPVTYPELEDEMWCHRYYLRNLCDEARFPDWPIVEHVEFLQSLLAMWREELTRRPLELSEEQACEILEISKDDVSETSAPSEKEHAETGGQRRVKRKGRVDEEVLKRQYKKMAMKYHPDKNPEGRDQFMAVQTAYERLQASLAGGLQGPQSWRLRLLLKAQCILFRRYGAVLEPFKYAGYPMLLNAITLDDADPNFLSTERAPLLEAATELIWLTCVSSALNGEELVRDGGVQLLATLLGRCMPLVRPQTPPTEPAAVIVTNIMRTMAGLATFEIARREMMACPGLIPDIVHCTELERSTISIDSALQTMGVLCVDADFQDWLLSAGVLWFLLPLLLQYDATAEKKETGGPQGIGASVQGAKNLHAMLAARALAKLGGFMEGELSTPYHQEATAVLRGLLTPRVAAQLKDRSPREMLRNLTSNLETPHVIWNSVTRGELLRFVDQQRANVGPDGKYTLAEATEFKYKALSEELQVGDVYLRIFNQTPDFKVDNIDAFCDALLEYISEAVKRRRELATPSSPQKAPAPVPVTPPPASKTTPEKKSLFESPVKRPLFEDENGAPESLTPNGGETPGANEPPAAESGPVDTEQKDRDTTAEAGDSAQPTEAAGSVNLEAGKLVEHLAMALQALLNVLTSDPHLAAVFSTRPQLAPLLGCLVDTSAASGRVPELALAVLTRLTAHAPCVEAMVADRGGLILLFQLLHTAPHLRSSVLHVLAALASTADAAWAAAKNGGAIFILEVLLPTGQTVGTAERAAAASLLGKLVAQPLHGPRVSIALGKFLPDGLVASIVDGPGEAVVSALGRTTETPELVWSPAMAASLAGQLATLGQELIREQAGGGADWEMPDSIGKRVSATGEVIPQDGAVDEPQVGGVYVRLFLKDPKFPLRNRKRFLEGLLDQYVATSATVRSGAGDPELPLLFSAALVSLLRVHPILADHVAHLGYINKLVGTMAAEGRRASMADGTPEECASENGSSDGPTPQERVRASCLRILHQLATSTACAEAMAAPNAGAPQVVPLLMRAVGWHGASVLALETLKRLVTANNRARDALVGQGLRTGLVPVLLALLDWRAGAKNGLSSQMKWNEAEASVGRVLAVEVLRLLASEGVHSQQVKEILDGSEIWRAYKDQKHDLFLPSSASSATGVAGLIEGPSSAAQYALPAPQSKVFLPDKSPPGKKTPSPGGASASSGTPPVDVAGAKDSTPAFQGEPVGPSTPGTPLPVSTTPLRPPAPEPDTLKAAHFVAPRKAPESGGEKRASVPAPSGETSRDGETSERVRTPEPVREAAPSAATLAESASSSASPSASGSGEKPAPSRPEGSAADLGTETKLHEKPDPIPVGEVPTDEEPVEFGDSGEAERQPFDGPPPL